MDYTHRLSISYYKVAAPINEPHKVFLVRHQETGKFYVRKTLDVFSTEVYEQLRSNPVRGIPKIMDFNEEDGKLTLIEAACALGARSDLGRPTTTAQENKQAFAEYLASL